jgi:hypothetical protein
MPIVISIPISNICVHNCMYSYKIKNNVVENNYFYNMTYSNDKYTLSNLYIFVPLTGFNVEKQGDRYILKYDLEQNKELIYQLKTIEEQILLQCRISKTPNYKLYKQFQKQAFNVFTAACHFKTIGGNTVNGIYIKMTGLWENETDYGLVYKIFID